MNEYMKTVELFANNPSDFLWHVEVPIGIWLVTVLAFFILLLKKYTFGNWTTESPNPYAGETFDMPRGVFRGILTLTLLFVAIILELVNVRVIGFESEMKEFMVTFQMMIAFYFGSKVVHHVTSVDKKKTESISNAKVAIASNQNETDGGGGDFDEEGSAG